MMTTNSKSAATQDPAKDLQDLLAHLELLENYEILESEDSAEIIENLNDLESE